MKKVKLFVLFFIGIIWVNNLSAQDTLQINFDETHYEDPRDGHGVLTLSIPKKQHINDYEGKLKVKYPANAANKDIAIGSIFFQGVENPPIDRSCALLFVNFKSDTPFIYVDRNYNLDFSDDGEPIIYQNPTIILLENTEFTGNFFKVKINRKKEWSKENSIDLFDHFAYKGKDRYKNKITDITYWYADARLNYRKASVMIDSVNYKLLLHDYDCDGLYSKILLNGTDNEDLVYLDTTLLSNNVMMFIPQKMEKDGTPTLLLGNEKYIIVEIAKNGDYMKIVKADSLLYKDSIPSRGIIDMRIEDYAAKQYDLAEVADSHKYTLIDIWGIWCKPCINSLPEVADLTNKYPDSLKVIGMHYGTPKKYVLETIEKYKIFWPMYYVNKPELDLWNIHGFPTYIVLDPQQQLIYFDSNLTGAQDFFKAQFGSK